jgi:uncharacterized protein
VIAALLFASATIAVPASPTSYVTDTASALSSAARDEVENELEDFKAKTGDQVIVWIGETTGDVPLETWTSRAADAWKIGRAHKDDGAILFLFMHDRKVRIEVGYGLEATLTDAKAAHIIATDIVPQMRRGDADDAVRLGIDDMLETIEPTYESPKYAWKDGKPPASNDDDTGDGIAGIVILLLLVGLVFAIILTIVRRGKLRHDWMDGFLISSAAGPSDVASRTGHWSGGGGGGGSFGGGGGFGGGGASGGW